MANISKKFVATVKLNRKPAYRIAQQTGIDPSTLSKLICGITPIKAGDPRVIAVGEVLQLKPDECFE